MPSFNDEPFGLPMIGAVIYTKHVEEESLKTVVMNII